MSNTSNASKNVRRFLLLFALGVAYGFMYVMPYMKSSFYDQMIAAMGCTNAQLGSLMTYYTIALTISYLPGGWIGDKFSPKPVLLLSIFGQAALSFLFMFTYQSYTMAVIVWLLMALTGGFAFWPAIMKGIRMTGTDEEQGRIYGIFEALNGFASLLLSFIMIGIMAIAGKGDLVTGFKSALACMGGLSLVSGLLVLFLMPKNAEYGASAEENAEDNKITVKDYLHAFKIPGVWIMAILVWCYVTISAVASYLTPYSTDVLGMSAVVAASIGTIRTYGCRLVGGPLGGFLADKTFKSVSKEQVLGQTACVVTLGIFLILPVGTNSTVLVILLLLVALRCSCARARTSPCSPNSASRRRSPRRPSRSRPSSAICRICSCTPCSATGSISPARQATTRSCFTVSALRSSASLRRSWRSSSPRRSRSAKQPIRLRDPRILQGGLST